MVLDCNIFCRSISIKDEEDLGIQDPGKWMPGFVDLARVQAVKLTCDDEDDETFNLTTLYLDSGDTYVVDIPFPTMSRLYIELKGGVLNQREQREPRL